MLEKKIRGAVNPQTNIAHWIDPDKEKKHKVDWSDYNKHMTAEKLMFLDMLRELCRCVEQKKRSARRGRPSMSFEEVLFCMNLMIYHNKSSRRTISELQLTKDRGLLNKVPHYNTILKYFNFPDVKDYLVKMIEISSLPLKQHEKYFAADSTGFSTSSFGRWFNSRVKSDEHRIWRKAHVMCGVNTQIITAVCVDKGTSPDSKAFPDLVNNTRKNFDMKEVSADLIYSCRDNFEVVAENGAIPFIPFKSNATKRPRGSMIWKKMYLYFKDYYDEYMEHYHRRSSVESTFSRIKRKFGKTVRSKKEMAQDNEILCKILCHNICVLIRESFRLDVDVEFESLINHTRYGSGRQEVCAY